MITLIAACDRNGAIGKNNEIPWHAPEDLAFFKQETLGGAIIMGRNTWNSLPFKPLKNRLNLVISSRLDLDYPTYQTTQSAVEAAYDQGVRRIYGIGGARIYAELLHIADRLLITEVDVEVFEPDVFFPIWQRSDWSEVGRATLRDEGPNCVVSEFIRTVR